jgi:predicted ATPase
VATAAPGSVPVEASHPSQPILLGASEIGQTPFIARESELARLVECFEAAKGGHRQFVLIGGADGVGKSRLVAELRRALALAGEEVTWMEGACTPVAQPTPLSPLIDQLREYFDLQPADREEDVVAKIDAAMESHGDAAALVPYIRYVLAVDIGDSAVASMSAAVRRARIFASLRALAIRYPNGRPTVLVVEDLQWSDSGTEEYLASLVEAEDIDGPLMVITTHRDGYTPRFTAPSPVTALTLHPFNEAEILSMAAAVLGVARLPERLQALLLEKTHGLPLHVEQIIAACIDSGVLQRQGGEYHLAPNAAHEVPATLDEIITNRLERLGDSARRLVQIAAVLGGRFDRPLLERVGGSPRLDDPLGELERRAIVRQERSAGEPSYAFAHAAIQEVAYRAVLPHGRAELHRAVGHAIEARHGERRPEQVAQLARHFALGELWGKVVHCAALAGDHAAGVYANREAADFYAQAVDAAERLRPAADPATLAALHAKRGAVLRLLGEYDAGVAAYEQALQLTQGTADRRAETEVLLGMADLYYNHHQPEPAQRYCDAAYDLATALSDAALQAACLTRRAGYIAAWQGPIAAARSAGRAALECAEPLNDTPLRSRTLIHLGSVLQWRADFDACLPYLHEGAQLAHQLQAGYLRGLALFHLGHAYLSTGRYDQALRWYGEMQRYAESADDTFWGVRVPNLIGGVHLELYDLDTAIDRCREGDDIAQRFSPWPEPRGHCLVKLGLAHLMRSEHGVAADYLRTACGLLNGDSWARWRWHIPLLRARAELALATGQLDDAWNLASQSLDLAAQTDSRKHVAHAKLVLGEIAVAQDRLPEAEKLLRNAVTLADHIHTARELWLAGSALGRTLALLGRDREAETYLTQAAQTIEAIATSLTDRALRTAFTRADPVAEVYRRLGHRPLP